MRCKYCGAVMKEDSVGHYCPTPNCDWQHGIPESEEPKNKRSTKAAEAKEVEPATDYADDSDNAEPPNRGN